MKGKRGFRNTEKRGDLAVHELGLTEFANKNINQTREIHKLFKYRVAIKK